MTQQRFSMEHFRTSDGVQLAYVVDDYTDRWTPAETLILVHAAMGSSRRFYAWVPHLARHFRVVRIDQRGHGDSEAPAPTDFDPLRLAKDVLELADHLGVERFHIAGSSAGAVVSQMVTLSAPERVLSLSIYASTAGIKQNNQDHMQWVKRIGEVGLPAFLRETIHDRVDASKVDPGFIDWFIGEAGRTNVPFLARFVQTMRTVDLSDRLPTIRCPALAVAPGGDPFHPVDRYRQLQRSIPNCEFLVYDGLPHNITDTVPDRCARDLAAFLQRHPGGR